MMNPDVKVIAGRTGKASVAFNGTFPNEQGQRKQCLLHPEGSWMKLP
jgi:hypothetical protein